MKHKTRTMAKRWLALVLCLCMTCSSALTFVSAAEKQTNTGGLCEHHKSHTAECGYVEAVAGHPCAHVHDENCGYREPAEEIPCTHTHDASCGYQEAKAEIPCDKGCIDVDGDGNIDHQEGCSYQPAERNSPVPIPMMEAVGIRLPQREAPVPMYTMIPAGMWKL